MDRRDQPDENGHTERWQRRERKLRKRRETMPVSGAGLKKVILPLVKKKAKEAERKAIDRANDG